MANYPLAVFHYKVSWNNQDIGFSDVSGLTQEIQPIEVGKHHRIAVAQNQVGLTVDVCSPPLPGLFHRQIRATDRS